MKSKSREMSPKLQPLLQAIPGVHTVQTLHSNSRSLIRIILTPGAESGPAITYVIGEAGLSLYEMRRTRPTLEDVFLELTTQESVIDEQATSPDPKLEEKR